MNPPLGSGAISNRRVEIAGSIVGADSAQIVNLFSIPTRSFADLAAQGRCIKGWTDARVELAQAIDSEDELLFGWGVKDLPGVAGQNRREQIKWVQERLLQSRPGYLPWTLLGQPRHPSRWHQFVSADKGRGADGSFRERLQAVLRQNRVNQNY